MKKKYNDPSKLLTNSTSKRSAELVDKTKKAIDRMVSEGIPLTAKRIALNAGCSVSFVYKNEEIQTYIKSLKQAPTVGKRTYTELEEANKRIRELEIQNMVLAMENVNLYREIIYVINKTANTIELNTNQMEEVIRRAKEHGKK